MKTKHQYLLVFFWIALLADCYLIFSQQQDYRVATKGALMPLLLVYYLLNSSRRQHLKSKTLTIVALLLAWAGDIVLLEEGDPDSFMIGLGLFLAMHVIYIIYFWRIQPLFPIKDSTVIVLPLIMVAAFDFLIMRQLLPLAGDLGKPLIAYMVVISVMLITACNILAGKKAKSLAVSFFVPGSILFIASDTLLGLNMFLWEDHLIGIAIMLTYGYAQNLIVHGFIKHVKGRG